ncbi:MAG TPA: pyridoxal-phosphate dependent enzyme [Bryobacteraceae bacterium]|nr:pyridoxal-phosphate dependent enzyme [Bryobacteraceae bacterium]
MIREAAEFLRGRVRRTPLEFSPGLSDLLGVPVWLKLESMQLTGSFKIRGALFSLSRLSEAGRAAGVVTCSAGNHGKAVAYAAQRCGVPAIICVPRSIDRAKYQGMLALNADLRVSAFDGYDDTEEWARAMAREEGRPFLSPFDDDGIMAANGGTVALEVFEDAPAARVFVLPVGGGGFAAGFAFAAEGGLIIGCQHELSPALRLSLDAGRAITKLPAVETMAGGIEGGIGALTFGVLANRVGRVALVSEDEILTAVRWMIEHHQYLIEPTAAVTIAACLSGRVGRITDPAVVVVSGRNVSIESAKKILCGC